MVFELSYGDNLKTGNHSPASGSSYVLRFVSHIGPRGFCGFLNEMGNRIAGSIPMPFCANINFPCRVGQHNHNDTTNH